MKRVLLFLASSLVTYLLVSTLAWPYTKLSTHPPAASPAMIDGVQGR